MTRWIDAVSGLTLIMLLAGFVTAQGKVNFSGTWLLDQTMGDISQITDLGEDTGQAQYSSMTMVVDQQGNDLKVTRILKSRDEERKEIHAYKIEGTQSTNTGFRGETVVSRAFWEGEHLVIVSTRTRRLSLKDVSAESRGVWSLSRDGKRLSVTLHIDSPRGQRRLKAVFEKQ